MIVTVKLLAPPRDRGSEIDSTELVTAGFALKAALDPAGRPETLSSTGPLKP
jgi:hypothetical protein